MPLKYTLLFTTQHDTVTLVYPQYSCNMAQRITDRARVCARHRYPRITDHIYSTIQHTRNRYNTCIGRRWLLVSRGSRR
jgi:hypothetical protein